jgi:hypothetical protein
MDWIFWAFLGASVLHVTEEYGYPGGFLAGLREASPAFAPAATARFAFVINALFLALCVVAALVGARCLWLGLSIAALMLWNTLLHLGTSLKLRRYMPGTVTAVALYIPLGLFAYERFLASGRLDPTALAVSIALGLAWNLVPIGYLALARKHRT